jgi:hypothetical protein
MIIIKIKEIQFKTYSQLKTLINRIKNDYITKVNIVYYNNTYITTTNVYGNNLLVPVNTFNKLGYSKDFTNQYLVFNSKDTIKKYIKNRIKSIKLKMVEDVSITQTNNINFSDELLTYPELLASPPISLSVSVTETLNNLDSQIDWEDEGSYEL